MKKYSDEELIQGIRRQDNQSLRFLYKNYFPVVEAHILSNSGSSQDAKDIFQEAVVVLFRKVQQNDFVLTSTLKTFLFAICKKMWLMHLRSRPPETDSIDHHDLPDDNESDEYTKSMQYGIYQKAFQKLKEDCKRLLELFLKKISLREIARVMKYKSEDYAKRRKFLCKEKLVEIIRNDPEFKNLDDNNEE